MVEVNQVNHLYGVNLSENDLSELGEIENILALDKNTKAIMTGDNTEENKKAYLKKQFESAVYGLVGKNIEMFKKLETNQSAQNMIFKAIYKNYKDMMEHIERFNDHNINFLVFGRKVGRKFISLDQIKIPEIIQDRCTGFGEESFRDDISSTKLRLIKND